MRTIVVFLLLVFVANGVNANDIDKLKTVADVQQFLMTKVNKQWEKESIIESDKKDTSAFNKASFLKLDLNNDGFTDLLIEGKYLVPIIDSGNGRYNAFFVDRDPFDMEKYV